MDSFIVDRLKDYPQYCQHLASIGHFSQFPHHLQEVSVKVMGRVRKMGGGVGKTKELVRASTFSVHSENDRKEPVSSMV